MSKIEYFDKAIFKKSVPRLVGNPRTAYHYTYTTILYSFLFNNN